VHIQEWFCGERREAEKAYRHADRDLILKGEEDLRGGEGAEAMDEVLAEILRQGDPAAYVLGGVGIDQSNDRVGMVLVVQIRINYIDFHEGEKLETAP
jgi:hypothetical protein